MGISDFILGHIEEKPLDERHFYFWVRAVIDAMALLGPETDADLEWMCQLVLAYFSCGEVEGAVVDAIPREIVRLRGTMAWADETPLGLKYRCLNALGTQASHVKRPGRTYADLFGWAEGINTAFQIIGLDGDLGPALEALVREHARKCGVELHDWRSVQQLQEGGGMG